MIGRNVLAPVPNCGTVEIGCRLRGARGNAAAVRGQVTATTCQFNAPSREVKMKCADRRLRDSVAEEVKRSSYRVLAPLTLLNRVSATLSGGVSQSKMARKF